MKKQKLSFSIVFVICCLAIFSLIACDTASGDSNSNDDSSNKEAGNNENNQNQNTPAVYNGFYNYPIGRVDPTGTLTVENKAAAKVLLFNGTVEGNNFLGTIDSLSKVTLKLPEEKFYSIVAVDAKNYEERTTQAAQTSEFTYYSNTQPYNVSVSTSGSSGAGTMLINNPTSYWVTIKSSDLSQNYAVVAPKALRVSVPIEMNITYDYKVYFTKEVTFNGKVIAVVETTDANLSGTAFADSEGPIYPVPIGGDGLNPSSSLKPSILVKNATSTHSIYCLKGNTYLSNGAVAAGNFVLRAGRQQLFVDLNAGDKLNTINFENMAWTDTGKGNLYMNDDTVLENGKVYVIEVSGTSPDNRACSLVSVEDAEAYFEANK